MAPFIGQGFQTSGTGALSENTSMTAFGSSQSKAQSQAQGTGATSTSQVYQPWQSVLQAQAGGAAGDFLNTGNLPGTFGSPPEVTRAYIDDYDRFVAPRIAASQGAGSPALASNLSLGLEQLKAQTYQNQAGNFSGALGQAGGIGFSSVGTTGSQQQQQTGQSQENSNWQSTQFGNVNVTQAASDFGVSFPFS